LASIDDFNALPEEEATRRLHACLANRGWASRIASGRPYSDGMSLITAAWLALNDLTDADWVAAFKAHPRIGEHGGDAPEVSAREQSAAMRAGANTLAALATENQRYEEKFGYVFLIRASGRSADEIGSELQRRMSNDAGMEFAEARRELAQIAELRLGKLVSV